MAQTVIPIVNSADRERLATIFENYPRGSTLATVHMVA